MIFIDFEGYVNKNPSLAGYLIGNEFKQMNLDKKLTRVQKSKWTKLLNHKKVDVDGKLFIKDKLEISFK